MADRYFKLHEAQELLPVIGSYLEQAREQKLKVDGLNEELAHAAARIMLMGGSIPAHAELGKKKTERDEFVSQVQEAVSKILDTGCLVKDLDEGLVDFPCLMHGEEAYLCWKLGEERIGYWHGIEEGFAGRKPLDDSSSDDSPPRREKIQ
ncbi:MAG: DUF2203 domain-containing protein [Terriglobia bacterium]|jgi:hypothetical protein